MDQGTGGDELVVARPRLTAPRFPEDGKPLAQCALTLAFVRRNPDELCRARLRVSQSDSGYIIHYSCSGRISFLEVIYGRSPSGEQTPDSGLIVQHVGRFISGRPSAALSPDDR